MATRRTDLRRGAIDLETIVSNPSMIDENGKLAFPQGQLEQTQIDFLNKLIAAFKIHETDSGEHILEPTVDLNTSLGSYSLRFREIFVSSNSIYLGNKKISINPTSGLLDLYDVDFEQDTETLLETFSTEQIKADLVSDSAFKSSIAALVPPGPEGPQGPAGATGATGPQGPQGDTGAPGAPGQDGLNGQDGVNGLSAYEVWTSEGNSGSKQDFLLAITGPQGLKGDKGDQGDVGPIGPQGNPGQNGVDGVDGATGSSAYEIWLSLENTGSQEDFLSSLVGPKGDTGNTGLTGPQGLKGDKGDTGEQGPPGPDGADGSSAYELWLSLGNTGTQQDFISSLTGPKGDTGDVGPQGLKGDKGDTGDVGPVGPQGNPGQDGVDGTNGLDGQNGDSAYDIWLSLGNTGTEAQFLASLVGPQGQQGEPGSNGTDGLDGSNGLSAYEIWLSLGNIGSETEFLASLTGPTGEQGPAGPTGPTGPQGEQGEPGQDFDPTLHISDEATSLTTLWSSQKTQTQIDSAVSSYVETDPVFLASPAASITASSITNWNEAYSWGDHSQAGYLTSETPDTLTSISLNANQLSYTDENGTVTDIDLSLYLDDTNLARVISGVYDSQSNSLVFTRDDATTFSVDASMFFDDTNLVTSVNGTAGAVLITAATLGLGNVDNTSDSNKPISNATQAALDLKLDATSLPTTIGSFTNDAGYITNYTVTESDVTAHQAALRITENQISNLGSYELADPNIVKDANYVHIDVTSTSVTDGTNTFQKYLDSEAREAIGSITMDMTGFPSRDTTTLTFDPTSRRLTLAPVSTSFTLWYRGQEIVISSALTIDITDNDGGRYIKYNPETSSLEELAIGAHPSLLSDLLVSYIFWDSVNSKAVIFGDERHSSHRDTQWHLSQHLDVGAIWRSGGALGYQLQNVNDVTLTLGDITIADEDLVHVIQNGNAANPYKQVLDGDAEIPVVYKNGSVVTQTAAAPIPWVTDAVSIRFNEIVNDSGSLVTVSNGNYISYYLVATNDSAYPIKLMMGHEQYSTAAAAEAEEFINLGFPVPELVPLYKITLQAKTSGPYKCQIHSVAQLSGRQSSLNAAFSATSHDALTERSLADQHPISAITGLQAVLDSKETADATILKDADIGVTVQAYDVNIVSDANYVHTDNNYDLAAVSKLAGIDIGATDDQTAQEIVDAIDADSTAKEDLKVALSLGTAAYTASTDYATPADISSLSSSINLKADQISLDSTDSALSTLQASVSANSSSIATLDSSLNTAQSDISALETTATTLQAQITSNDSDINGLDTRLAAAEAGITGNDSDISGLDTRLTNAEGNITTLQSNVSSNDSDIASLQSDLATAQSNITTLQGNVSSNDTDIASLNTRLTSAEANITSNDGDILSLNTDVSALDTRLTTAESNISGNDTDIAGLDTRLTAVETNITSNNGDITALQTAVSGNDADILAIQGDVSTLQSDLNTAETTIVYLQTQVSSNDTDIASLQGRVTSTEANVSSNNNDLTTLSASVSSITTDLASAQTTIAAHTSDIADLDTRITAAQADINILSDVSALTNSIAQNASDISDNSSAISILQTRDGGLLMETEADGVYMPASIMLSTHAGPFRIDFAQAILNSGDADYIFYGGKSTQLQDRHFTVDVTTGDISFTGTTL